MQCGKPGTFKEAPGQYLGVDPLGTAILAGASPVLDVVVPVYILGRPLLASHGSRARCLMVALAAVSVAGRVLGGEPGQAQAGAGAGAGRSGSLRAAAGGGRGAAGLQRRARCGGAAPRQGRGPRLGHAHAARPLFGEARPDTLPDTEASRGFISAWFPVWDKGSIRSNSYWSVVLTTASERGPSDEAETR
jgi:hypothetical protein